MSNKKKNLNIIMKIKLFLIIFLLPSLTLQNQQQMCSMTHLIPEFQSVRSTENSPILLKTKLKNSTSNAELSLFFRVKIEENEGNFLNLIDANLTKENNQTISLFKIRYDKNTSNFELSIRNEKNEELIFQILSKPLEINKWYFIAIAMDYAKGNAGIYVAEDDLQIFINKGKYTYIGAKPKFGSILPDTSHGKN